LGNITFQLDFALDLWQEKKEGREEGEEMWKTSVIDSMDLIHAFCESFPQFVLQTAGLFLFWTSGTEQQCFPSQKDNLAITKCRVIAFKHLNRNRGPIWNSIF
jgi:hypothetical protein